MYEQTIIIGNLGGDPVMRYTPSGVPVTNFSVAVTRRWKDREGNPQEKTKWVKVTAWRKLAELCNEYLSKGRLVMVAGKMDVEAWLSAEGEPRAALVLTAETVRFLGGRERSEGPRAAPALAPSEPGPMIQDDWGDVNNDGLPF